MKKEAESDEDDELNVGGLLKRAKKSNNTKKKDFKDREDGFNFLTPSSSIFVDSFDWSDDMQRDLIRNRFITGEGNLSVGDESDNDELDENDIFEADDEDIKMEVDENEDRSLAKNTRDEDKSARAKRLEAKEKLKARFNAEYDDQNENYNAIKEEYDAQAKAS